MQASIGDARVNYVQRGEGIPLVALHGAGVDHSDIESALESVQLPFGVRRIYVDLPGMGLSTGEGLDSNEDVVALLAEFIEHLGFGPVLLVGHSYGGYLARGVAHRHPELVSGLALLCPAAESTGARPEHRAVREDADTHDELAPQLREGFDEYFVVRTAALARRYSDSIEPGTHLESEAALERIFSSWAIEVGPFSGPTLIVTGRQDSVVGYTDAVEILDDYPGATLAIVDQAGHALIHERPDVLSALIAEWVDRANGADAK